MDMRIESVAAVLFSPDRKEVLLVQRRDVPVWVLPGGGIDPGESAEKAVIREVLEETGFAVKADRLVGRYVPINRLAKPTAVFECRVQEGMMSLTTETRGIGFFPLDALPALVPPPFREWIEDARGVREPVVKRLNGVTYWTLIQNLLFHPLLVIRFLLARAGFAINSSGDKQQSKYEGK